MNILIVEDDRELGEVISTGLQTVDTRYSIEVTRSLQDGVRAALTDPLPDVALVDLQLGDADGTLAPLALQAERPDMAIVVLTGNESEQTAVKLLREGIQDYLIKGDATFPEMSRVLNYAVQRHAASQVLRRAARTDPLTELLNRDGLEHAFEYAVERAARTKSRFACAVIDLDDFKQVNDRWGHAAGDEVLKVIAKRLINSVRSLDAVARVGGDEFTVLLNGLTEGDDLDAIAAKLLRVFARPVHYEDVEIDAAGTIGIVMASPEHGDPWELMKAADRRMYSTKRLRHG